MSEVVTTMAFVRSFHGFRMWSIQDEHVIETPFRKIDVDMERVFKKLKGSKDVSVSEVEATILEIYLDKKEKQLLAWAQRESRRKRLGQTFKQYLEDLQPLEPMAQEHKRYARQHWKEDQAALKKEFQEMGARVVARCKSHKRSKLSYIAKSNAAEKRLAAGEKQKQCPKCKRWFWKDEY